MTWPVVMGVCGNFRSMLGRISAESYSFDQSFYTYNSDRFALVRLIYHNTAMLFVRYNRCTPARINKSRERNYCYVLSSLSLGL